MEDENEVVELIEEKNEEEVDDAANGNEEVEVKDSEEDEIVVSIAGEKESVDETKAPDWVRDLRKSHRELQKQNRELQERLQSSEPKQQVQIGEEPTLAGCDYDEPRLKEELLAWHRKKLEIENQENRRRAELQSINEAWNNTLAGYETTKKELKVKDFADSEEIVKETLSVVQQGIMLQGCDNSALVVYALGKNPKKAKELASISDPVKFAFAISKLENQLKVTNRKTPPPPEKAVSRGSASISGSVDSKLEQLRKGGDMAKIIAYKRQLREKKK